MSPEILPSKHPQLVGITVRVWTECLVPSGISKADEPVGIFLVRSGDRVSEKITIDLVGFLIW